VTPAPLASVRWLAMQLLIASAALTATACDDSGAAKSPSPQVIQTAESISRRVSIAAPFSTTPEKDDADREQPITLAARVFGSGSTGVILIHERPADQTSWFPLAAQLANTGTFTVLTFDFRGFGGSPGEKEFDRFDTDIYAAYAYMHDTLGITRIFLVGASTGGTAALMVAARVPVAGVVSLSAEAQYQTLDALAAVPSIAAPKLFIASKKDAPAARSETLLWDAAQEPKQEQIYEGNAHGMNIFATANGGDLERRITDFLTAN
jgi:pimeloyl-ACP methyl ester carboxylesterase